MSTPGTQIAEALGLLLLRSSRARLYGRLTAGLDPSVDPATYPVISGLARTGSMSSARLAAEVGIDRSVVSRHAMRLARHGLVKRVRDPADGRAMLLVLTVRGRQVVQIMRLRLAAALDEHLSHWPPGEARRFAADLERFAGQGLFRLTWAPPPGRVPRASSTAEDGAVGGKVVGRRGRAGARARGSRGGRDPLRQAWAPCHRPPP